MFLRCCTCARYHASGVEALAFFRGEFDASRPGYVKFWHLVNNLRLYMCALWLVLAALLVVAMGDRVTGRSNGVLQYALLVILYHPTSERSSDTYCLRRNLRALRLGSISVARAASRILQETPQLQAAYPPLGELRPQPVTSVRHQWKSLA